MGRLTDRPDMTIANYRGRKTIAQQQQEQLLNLNYCLYMRASFELKAISVVNKADTKLNRTNVRLAGDHLYEKFLVTWLSLVMSLMVSFDVVLFSVRCLG